MIKPIRPDNVVGIKAKRLPPEVISSFNHLIAKNYLNGKATVKQDDVIKLILSKTNYERHEIFERKMLDIENIYEEAGWEVTYDKPGYNESYAATFEFRIKK